VQLRDLPSVDELVAQPHLQVTGLCSGADLLSRLLEHHARGSDRERIVRVADELVYRRKDTQLHNLE